MKSKGISEQSEPHKRDAEADANRKGGRQTRKRSGLPHRRRLRGLESGQRLAISCLVALIAVAVFKYLEFPWASTLVVGWDIFAVCLIILSWITFTTTSGKQIRKELEGKEPTFPLIFVIVVAASVSSLLAVLKLLYTTSDQDISGPFHTPISIIAVGTSWGLMHTIFTFRYAYLYYRDHHSKRDTHSGGLDFPSNQEYPDFMDFAYFSFVLGMTFQVSDIVITSPKLRRLALFHSILSFGFNTIIIALSINIIASLR